MRYPMMLAAAGLLAVPGMAAAHARLTSSTPAAGATVAAPAGIDLHFSEPLVARLSGAEVAPAGKAAPAARSAPGTDARSLHIALPRPLASGGYVVTYHVVSADTHRVAGRFAFRVK